MFLGVPKVPKRWGRGCPTGASCICAWVPTFKKQLGQFSFKETYLPGILGWGSHNKRLQFFVLCHHMWFFGELGEKNSINRLLAPEKQHHKKSWSHKILCPISLGRHQWKKNVFLRALPESPNTPRPDPNTGNLVPFFWTSKFKIWKSLGGGEGDILTT